jgi:hypothetical protein
MKTSCEDVDQGDSFQDRDQTQAPVDKVTETWVNQEVGVFGPAACLSFSRILVWD